MSEKTKTNMELVFQVFCFFVLLAMFPLSMWITSGCTVSFNNIRTQGEASDVVDETLRTDPTTSPTISAELPLPKFRTSNSISK